MRPHRDKQGYEYLTIKADTMPQINFKIKQLEGKGWRSIIIESYKPFFSRTTKYTATLERKK